MICGTVCICHCRACWGDVAAAACWAAHTHTRLTALCPGLPRWAGTKKVKPIWNYWSKRQWVTVASAGPYAPCSRQITTPAPHHSVFYRPDAFPAAQPTASKYWRQCTIRQFQCTLGSNQSISPACWDHSSKPTTAVQWVNGTDRQTDTDKQTDTDRQTLNCYIEPAPRTMQAVPTRVFHPSSLSLVRQMNKHVTQYWSIYSQTSTKTEHTSAVTLRPLKRLLA